MIEVIEVTGSNPVLTTNQTTMKEKIMTLDEAADEFNAVSIEVTLQIMERFMRPTLNINPNENREQYGYDREVTDKLEKEIRDTIVRVGNYFEEIKSNNNEKEKYI